MTQDWINKERELFDILRTSRLKEYGWDLLIIYAQFICESGGRSELLTNANNPFSVKATKNWPGEVYHLVDNPEEVDGVMKKIPDNFKKFPTLTEALGDYVWLIKRVYPQCYEARGRYKDYYKGLQSGQYKYATDSKYVIKLTSKYEEFKGQNNGEFYQLLMGV